LQVDVPEGEFKTQIQTLASQPGMEYLNQLTTRSDVNWKAIKLANDQWDYNQSGLTPAGAALLSVVVAFATGGAGAGIDGLGAQLFGATSGGITTTMANAAFASLSSQAAITLVNNKGDLGKTLKDLGNSNTVKAALSAAITAGVMDKIGGIPGMKNMSNADQWTTDKFAFNLINATGRALTSTSIKKRRGQTITF
jgi:filamentous hemagglutinin